MYGKSGVPERPVHSIIDGSKLKDLKDCPRGFFFRHILGWTPEDPNIHLVFGSALHAAMESFLIHGMDTEEKVQMAYLAFMDTWDRRTDESPFPDNLTEAKNPEQAMLLLYDYAERYKGDMQRFETLYTEVQGVFPINKDGSRILHFNMDGVLREVERDKIVLQEHKSTGRHSKHWETQWDYTQQVTNYFLAGVMHFGFERVDRVEVNGLVVRRPTKSIQNNFDFLRIPVRKSGAQLQANIAQLNHWWDYLEWNKDQLCKTEQDSPVLQAFPPNDASCAKFGCRFYPHCQKANPLAEYGSAPPIGYKEEFWDPTKRDTIRYTLDLTEGKGEIKPKQKEDDDD